MPFFTSTSQSNTERDPEWDEVELEEPLRRCDLSETVANAERDRGNHSVVSVGYEAPETEVSVHKQSHTVTYSVDLV